MDKKPTLKEQLTTQIKDKISKIQMTKKMTNLNYKRQITFYKQISNCLEPKIKIKKIRKNGKK